MADDKKKVEEVKKEEPLSDMEKIAVAVKMALSGMQQPQAQPAKRDDGKNHSVGQRCPECSQPGYVNAKEGLFFACRGKHTRMVVFPAKYTEWFQGVCLNGIWYRSNGHGHLLTVPAENEIGKFLENWDNQEEEYRNGKKIRPSTYNPISRGS